MGLEEKEKRPKEARVFPSSSPAPKNYKGKKKEEREDRGRGGGREGRAGKAERKSRASARQRPVEQAPTTQGSPLAPRPPGLVLVAGWSRRRP